MAKKELSNLILNLFSKLGGNMNNVLGSRSNITFLGKGKNPEGFIDSDINIEAIGAVGKNKILEELESSIGYLTADKLNDVQAGKLYENMLKVDSVFNPKAPPANITDLASGTGDLTPGGLEYLRLTGRAGQKVGNRQLTPDEYEDFVDEIGGADRLEAYTFDGTVKDAQRILAEDKAFTDEMFSQYKAGKLDPKTGERGRKEFLQKKFDEMEASGDKRLMTRDEIEELSDLDLPPPGSRGGPDDIAAPLQDADTTIRNLEKQDPELAAQFKAMMIGGNQGGNPSKRATAREFLVEALKEDEVAKGGNTFSDFVSAEDVKYITEGGGGIAGDPLVLVNKYFGPRIAEMIPEGASSEEIVIFTKRVLNNVVDAAGNKPNSPDFDRLTARILDIDIPGGPKQPFAKGGLAKILEV